MKFIVVSGIDGSGKTTVIDGVKSELEKQGKKVYYMWMRYNHYLVKIMNTIARILGFSIKTDTKIGKIWVHHYYKSSLFFKLYVISSYIDNRIFRYKATRHQKSDYDYVIVDRWINDVLIDLGSDAHNHEFLDTKWYKKFQSILPKNSVQFLINRNLEEIAGCRPECDNDPNFTHRFELYKALIKKPEVVTVNNNSTIQNSVDQILKCL